MMKSVVNELSSLKSKVDSHRSVMIAAFLNTTVSTIHNHGDILPSDKLKMYGSEKTTIR